MAPNWVYPQFDVRQSHTATDVAQLERVMRFRSFEGRRGGLRQPSIGFATAWVDAPGGTLQTSDEALTDFKQMIGRPIDVVLYEHATGDRHGRIFRGVIVDVESQRREQSYVAVLQIASLGFTLNEDVTLPASAPAESVTARVNRIAALTGSPYTVAVSPALDGFQCVSPSAAVRANAQQLIRSTANTGAGTWWGNLYLDSVSDQAAQVLWITDEVGTGTGFKFASQPYSESDPRLLVTATEFRDGLGMQHAGKDQAAIDEWGRHPLRLSAWGSAAATQALSTYWLARYNEPYQAVLECVIRPNDTLSLGDCWADHVIGVADDVLRPGIQVNLSQAAGNMQGTTNNRLEGIEWEIDPWHPQTNRCLVRNRLWLLPTVFLASTRWELGVSSLGVNTGFTGEPASTDPAFRWPAGANVSAAAFNAFLVRQSPLFWTDPILPAGSDRQVLIHKLSGGTYQLLVHRGGSWSPDAIAD